MKEMVVDRKFFLQVQSSPSYNNNFALLAKDLARYQKKKYRVLLVSASETRGRRLCQDLQEYDLHASYSAVFPENWSRGRSWLQEETCERDLNIREWVL